MIHKQPIMMLVIATSLIFANFHMAHAETTVSVDDSDKRMFDAIDKKRAEAVNKILAALAEYKESLNYQAFTNPSTERRVVTDNQSIENKIKGISEFFQNVSVASAETTKALDEPYLKQIAEGKFRPHLKNYYKVTYQVFAPDFSMDDVHIRVTSDLDTKQQSVGNIFAKSSNKATFVIKAIDPTSITASIVS